MVLRRLIWVVAALAMVVVVAGCGSAEQTSSSQPSEQKEVKKEQPKEPRMSKEAKKAQVAPKQGKEKVETNASNPEVPKNTDLKLTVPKMARIQNDTIPTTTGTDEVALRNFAGIHLKGTGFPWEEQANVYIAGHRLGFPGTQSDLAFDDLNVLENGDKIYLTDANGKKYTYEVFRKFVAGPYAVQVTAPPKGENVVSLQTCTLPDYSNRLIVRGKLVSS